jgi:AraC-like DNA-binding protein
MIEGRAMAPVLINPDELSLGSPNTILSGRARRHDVPGFDGPLSIKTVRNGAATWETPAARHRIGPSDLLVLNHGQRYSLVIDAPAPVETFCLFFAPRFMAAARRALTTAEAALLDDPEAVGETIEFPETVQPGGPVLPLLHQLYQAMRAGDEPEALESGFHDVARALLLGRADVLRQLGSLPSQRAATRIELYRRLQRARARADESQAALSLAELAGTACLSVHHFHRLFTQAFGETPHRYSVRKRLERAAAALRGDAAPVLEIALAHGFASLGSFTSLFRRHYGLPPAAWRKKQA